MGSQPGCPNPPCPPARGLGGVDGNNTATGTASLDALVVSPPVNGYALELAENPGYPVFYVDIKRRGKDGKMSFTILPTSFEYISSVKAADKLEFTVPDPSYSLIDSEWLQEDLKSTVEFRFGFEHVGHMSPLNSLVFFRQAPSFEQGSSVSTTVVAYDKGIFLSLPTVPKTVKKKGARGEDVLLTFNEVVDFVVGEVNDLFRDHLDQPFRVETGGKQWEGRHFRMSKPAGTALEYLIWLRNFAEDQNGPVREGIEVFVRNNTVYFRPAQKRVDPIAVYDYFSPVDGERLLSFKPEVSLTLSRKTLTDVDSLTGQPTEHSVSNSQNAPDRPRQTGYVHTSGASMAQTTVHPARMGDTQRQEFEPDDVVFTHTYKAGETLDSIGARYGVTGDEVFRQNRDALGGDRANPKFTPGMTLTVRTENRAASPGSPSANVSPANRVRAALAYVYEEDEAVRASATVMGDPSLLAGWPIVVRNVGKKWEGLWYIEEAKHKFDAGGYICDLSLTRDGFAIGEEMEEATGDKILETPARSAQAQEQRRAETAVVHTSGADMTQRTGR